MGKKKRSSVETYHDRVAGIYDTIYDGDPYWETVFEITWRYLKRFLPSSPAARCLDVGCGTGRWGLRILKSGFPTDFLDISQKMLDQVARKLSQDFPHTSSHLFHTSLNDLSAIPSETYDMIVGQGDPLCCAERPQHAFKELVRILKPGGILALSVDNRLAAIPYFCEQGDPHALRQFLRDGKTHWLTERKEEQFPLTMFGPDEIRSLCQARGLSLLLLLGKTVLPLRKYAAMLRDSTIRRMWIQIEESLHTCEALWGQAPHLDFVARKDVGNERSRK